MVEIKAESQRERERRGRIEQAKLLLCEQDSFRIYICIYLCIYIYGMHTYTKRNEERIWEALRGNEKEKRRRERQRN